MKWWMLILALVILPGVLGVTIPIDYSVRVDFTDVTDFTLFLPNGAERHFSWLTNQTHSDTIFNSTLYWPLNETLYCIDSSIMVQRYEDLADKYSTTLNLCNNLLTSYNDSYGFHGFMWQIQQERISTAENVTTTKESELASCKEKESACSSNLAVAQSKANELTACKSDLDKKDSEKLNQSIMFGIIGIVGTYLAMRKSKRKGPSDQVELGGRGDEFPEE